MVQSGIYFSNRELIMSLRPEPASLLQNPHGQALKTGILVSNLGTPDAATASAVRRYLKEFLSDSRVVEIPKPIWWLILNGVILNVRPKKTAAKYETVWMKEGSPLLVYTLRQAQLLKGYLGQHIQSPFEVAVGMRYGNPSLQSAIDELKAKGCNRILLLPMYPQYASSTTGTLMDQLGRVLSGMRNVPGIRTIRNFHDHPAYIKSIATNIEQHWMKQGRGDMLLMSFHGLPKFHLDKGDPYHCECHKTARLIAERLGIAREKYTVSFQSRFGKAVWLRPYTTQTIEALAQRGIQSLDVVCPGFAADCLETLEEIAEEAKHDFVAAGGKSFQYIPVANDTPAFMDAIAQIALENLGGWVSKEFDKNAYQHGLKASQARADEQIKVLQALK
jgi:protoporphyrin/coproporphyrin ferrochelatase